MMHTAPLALNKGAAGPARRAGTGHSVPGDCETLTRHWALSAS